MVLLSDPKITQIVCQDNKEKIISLRQIHNNIQIDETRSQISSKSELFCYARETIVIKIREAADHLPYGYQLLIKEAYRPLSRQKKSFEEAFMHYKEQYPDKADEEIYALTCQYVAPVKVAGHPTGGAIDVTLLKDGIELNMGTEFNDIPKEPENLTYLYSDYFSDKVKENRKILITCMEMAGFVNYPPEWWHWSYGDCYWAFLNHCDAIYSATDENEILSH